jgi:hypothetical protein
MTPAERREANRIRSERWRRAHGIMPRKPAQKPWLAEGVSRSTWYRRGNRVQKAIALAMHYPEPDQAGRGKKGKAEETSDFSQKRLSQARAILAASPDLSRAVAFTLQLQAELATAARCQAIAAAILGELGVAEISAPAL